MSAFLDRLPRVVIDPGIIDEDIEATVSARNLGRGVLYAVCISDIQGKRFGCADLGELRCCRPRLSGVSRCEQHGKASRGQLPTNLESNATICPGDQRHEW